MAFESTATNLVPGDTNGRQDIFVYDRQTGQTERANVASDGGQANDESRDCALSADGRYVTFDSYASNLVPGDTNSSDDVFVHDRQTGVTERVSIASDGMQGNGGSSDASLSADGRWVAFDSWATNLVPGDTNGDGDVFVRDRVTGVTERVSMSGTGEEGDGYSSGASLSADARYVGFVSSATNLVPGDTAGTYDVFRRDRLTGQTELVSVSTSGGSGGDQISSPAISADGRLIAFPSPSTNLVLGDTNGCDDVFLRAWCRFRDVLPFHWAFAQVEACVDANVVKGYDDETYRPTVQVTRDQMAVYISRALVIPSGDAGIPDPPPTPSFSDVPTDHWAYRHIEYAVSQNVVQGYADGTYKPNSVVDRGQMAVFVARAMVVPSGDAGIPEPTDDPTFSDVAADFWAYKQVEYCVGQGVVQGYDDGTYRPIEAVTRDQMAVYVARASELPM